MRVRSALRKWSMHSRVTMVVRYARGEQDIGVLVLDRPEPRVLHDILGFAGAAEHPVRNREQQRSMASNVPSSQSVAAMAHSPCIPSIFRRTRESVCDIRLPQRRCHRIVF